MLLERYINKGIMLQQLEAASKRVPITLDNGQVRVGDVMLGTNSVDYTIDLYDEVVTEAYRQEVKRCSVKSVGRK